MSFPRPLTLALTLAACSEIPVAPTPQDASGPRPDAPGSPPGDSAPSLEDFLTREVPASPQREGDAAMGYLALVNNGYVSCGIPSRVYFSVFGAAPAAARLPGRDPRNAQLPYNFTALTSPRGQEIVTANCLSCHAGAINGRLYVGLGNASADFTQDTRSLASAALAFANTPEERNELSIWRSRVSAISDYVTTRTIGVNPADNLTAILFAHRDRRTLAWSEELLLEAPPPEVVPVDVPPWWRMRKKNAMFYNASGRGDHSRIMMTASTLCTDSVAEAREIDAYFPHVRAYIRSISPPPWPFARDAALGLRGREVFEASCANCHGTYGPGESYPNLVVGLREIGTDRTLALGASQFSGRFIEWFQQSFYGEISRIEPQPGYVSPPLDGVWSTAPFLHNGSVPTVRALLDSPSRPRFWTRNFNDSRDYDPEAMGWRYTALDHGQSSEPSLTQRARIYDTTLPGYANTGHTYGDRLSAEEREDVLEYLKTL